MFRIDAAVALPSLGVGALGTVALPGLNSLTAAPVVGAVLVSGLCTALAGTGVTGSADTLTFAYC